MTDREKVIKGLECCSSAEECGKQCPYWDDKGACRTHLEADALALLKAQEPMKPVVSEEKYGDALDHCPSCERALPNGGEYGKSYYCYKCGQAVKWK